jgi:hypothetical protein
MQTLIGACKQAGVPVALHDNYIDFYPDAEGFSYEQNICFQSPGVPARAWLNVGCDAQSYRYRADRIEPFLHRNLTLIRDALAPTAYFIDVWSSVRPYDYWTADGRFFDCLYTRNTWGRHFAWIRDFLGGSAPQISESGHDQLIGWLDGGQANHLRIGRPQPGKRYSFVINVRAADAERTPWFDAAHHDRFILHGAGYPGRYEGGLDRREHGIFSDDYLATEVLTGHPAMVPAAFSRDVVRKYWLLHDLGRALALRTIEGVEYAGDDLHRQHVRWSGGGQVWVNRGPSDWTVAGVTLPEYGFLARVPTDAGLVETSIARRNGRVVEMARGPEELYVNARLPEGKVYRKLTAEENAAIQVVDFGPIVTAGGCRLTRAAGGLLITPLPRERGPEFAAAIRWGALPWSLPPPAHWEAIDADGNKILLHAPVRRDHDLVQIDGFAEAAAYRLGP